MLDKIWCVCERDKRVNNDNINKRDEWDKHSQQQQDNQTKRATKKKGSKVTRSGYTKGRLMGLKLLAICRETRPGTKRYVVNSNNNDSTWLPDLSFLFLRHPSSSKQSPSLINSFIFVLFCSVFFVVLVSLSLDKKNCCNDARLCTQTITKTTNPRAIILKYTHTLSFLVLLFPDSSLPIPTFNNPKTP